MQFQYNRAHDRVGAHADFCNAAKALRRCSWLKVLSQSLDTLTFDCIEIHYCSICGDNSIIPRWKSPGVRNLSIVHLRILWLPL